MTEYEILNLALQFLVFIAVVTTVIIYYKQLKAMMRAAVDGANANRKVITFQMLERWNSDSMTEVRASASPLLNGRYKDASTRIFLGDVFRSFHAGETAASYRSISTLSHFFADLNSLWCEGALDDRLACALFSRPIQFWFHYLRLIDSRVSADDISKPALNSNKWRAYAVLPLEKTLTDAQARTGYESPFALDDIGLRF